MLSFSTSEDENHPEAEDSVLSFKVPPVGLAK
jgi:hypothetical protein